MIARAKQPYLQPHLMTGKSQRILILLPWLALPFIVGSYAVLWSRLPAELAVKFDLSTGAATDTLGRTTSLVLDAVILLFVLGQFTFRLWGANGRNLRAGMLTYYVAVVFITSVFLLILKFNL